MSRGVCRIEITAEPSFRSAMIRLGGSPEIVRGGKGDHARRWR